MNKVLLSALCMLLAYAAQSQFSFKEINQLLSAEEKKESPREFYNYYIAPEATNKASQEKAKLWSKIKAEDSIYRQKRIFLITSDTIKDKNQKLTLLNKKLDSTKKEYYHQISELNYWEKYYTHHDNHLHFFFPAYYSTHSIAFFEGDSIHNKLFQNNLVNYSPSSKKMTLYTEAVNDYIGPFRIGIGFQIKSESEVDSLNSIDSTIKLENKKDLLSDLQNGGGDISINVRLPFIKSRNEKSLIQSKFYLYGNTGFSLPILSKATQDFIFNYSLGIEGALYAKGFNNRLTFFSQLKAGYYNGNKKYRTTITDADKNDQPSFIMLQSSFGFDFSDNYRFRIDLYGGNKFVKNNFPATVTFIFKPGK